MTFDREAFEKYIYPECDRLSFLQGYLAERGVSTSVIPCDDKKHLFVNFNSNQYDHSRKIKTIICHYDRVQGSPGANDNSAANFAIAEFAADLYKSTVPHNIRIFFTDGEELGEGGVQSQGAFGLAELFKKCGIVNDDVFVFDACGRGDVAVLTQAGLKAGIKGDFARNYLSLYTRTQELLKTSCGDKWTTLPVPYSDNAGFLAFGIPAVAITFLPEEEVKEYRQNLLREKNLEKAVMNMHLPSGAFIISSKSAFLVGVIGLEE